jgi:hypothetical protein
VAEVAFRDQWRSQRGRLHPIHRGVYAVGHAGLSTRGRMWAATLASPRAVLARAGLPRPAINQVVEGLEVDFVGRREKVIVETGGAATHLTAGAFERDRRRDARLAAAGWPVVPFTWRQVTLEPEVVAGVVRRLVSG